MVEKVTWEKKRGTNPYLLRIRDSKRIRFDSKMQIKNKFEDRKNRYDTVRYGMQPMYGLENNE